MDKTRLAKELVKVAQALIAEEPVVEAPAAETINPIDVAMQFTADVSKELLKLRKAYGIKGVRQNYKGTGSKRASRQLFVKDIAGNMVDVWLERDYYQIGGVINGLRGAFQYGTQSAAEVAKDIAEALKIFWQGREPKKEIQP